MTPLDTAIKDVHPRSEVLVAGAGGFIGGHLVRRLKELGVSQIRAVDIKPLDDWYQVADGVESLQMDLQENISCKRAVEGVNWVYNLAADMGGMGFIELNKAKCMQTVLINTNLLRAASEARISRYFFASSACVYSATKQTESENPGLREEDAYPAMPEDGYGWEKLFSERMCRHFREDYGMQTRIARFHNVYGPHGTYDGGREKAPAAICRKVITANLDKTDTIEIWGDGEQTRSFMYIDDCVDGILRIMTSDTVDPINLGSAEMVSINQLVDIVEDISGTKLKRRYNLSAPKGVRGRSSDNSKIKAELGWEPSIKLSDGIRLTYDWILGEVTKSR